MKAKEHIIIAVLLASTLQILNLVAADAQQASPPLRVACVGDSITVGVGTEVRDLQSYPAQLERMLGSGWQVGNYGVNGATLMSRGDLPYRKSRAFTEVLRSKPDIVVINLGANDSKHPGDGSMDSEKAVNNWQYHTNFVADYLSLLDAFRQVNPAIKLLVCLPAPAYPGRWGINDRTIREEMLPMIREVAQASGAGIVDLYGMLSGHPECFPDTVHPNVQGTDLIARAVYEEIMNRKFEGQIPTVTKTSWENFDEEQFVVAGHRCRVVMPESYAPGKPWIWRPEFFGAFATVDRAMLARGYALAFIEMDNNFGSPAAMKWMDQFYHHIVTNYNFSTKATLFGFSRGGLYALNWGTLHPERVACIYLDAPVCDFKSWPAGRGKGSGSKGDWEKLKKCYGFKSDEEAVSYARNPLDCLAPLRQANVAILSVCGDADKSVPYEENTAILKERYQALGGDIQVILKPGVDHHPHSLSSPEPIVNFILKHTAIPAGPTSGNAPTPFGPVPTARQLAWHQQEFIGFIHFTVNTFTDREWGYGDEDPKIFNPSAFSARQIVITAKDAGMKGLIFTCKHHDGFCLWPSKHTEHSVRNASWKNGNGDMVKELSDACRKQGIAFGVYLSPWDRNHKDYGQPEYLTYYRNQLRELLTDYGEITEVWFDGANGGDGFYGGAREHRKIDPKTYYDWPTTWQLVRELQPAASMFSDAGPDIRWVGNERGHAGDPCWATLNREDFAPGSSDVKRLETGDRTGNYWVPAECDVSIRKGWFYHPSEDTTVKTPRELVDLYFASVGRGAVLLLNLPPDRRGLIHERDIQALQGFRRMLDTIFARDLARKAKVSASNTRGKHPRFAPALVSDARTDTFWATDDVSTNPDLVLSFSNPVTFNLVRLREYLPLGQRVEGFALDSWQDGGWVEFGAGTSIGNCRLLRTEPVTTTRVRLRITSSPVCPTISEFGLFAHDEMQNAF